MDLRLEENRGMQLFGIHTKLIKPEDNLLNTILETLSKQELKIEDGDVLAIVSKAVATVQNQQKGLDSVRPSEKAKKLARKTHLEPSFVEIVLQEAGNVYGGVPKALLTLKDCILTANAGVDHKNSPKGYVTLWPKNPFKKAEEIRQEILERTGKCVGVLIVDSRVTPLRMGTTGLALAVAGFEPVRDCRNDKDLYGRAVSITRHALADDLASAAHLIMGETNEQVPAVLIKKAPVKFTEAVKPSAVVIPADQCLFAKHIVQKAVKECS
jgi:coenzyme F420-0:L-glutamate ligase